MPTHFARPIPGAILLATRPLPLLLLALCCAGCAPAHRPAAERAGIVSMAPNLTETVYALGQGHRMVAVGNFCDYPPEIAGLPRAGGYIDPDLEKITLLSPALILLPGKHDRVAQHAALNRLEVLHVDMDSLESIDAGIEAVGAALGVEAEADALRAEVQAELEAVRAAVAGRPRPKVLLVTTRQARDMANIYTTGSDSFVTQLVEVAGGENIFREVDQRYFKASKEDIVMGAPDVVIEFHAGAVLSEAQLAALKQDWNALPSLPAVREGRIYFLTEPHGLRPGPRVGEIARRMAGLLHPDAELAR